MSKKQSNIPPPEGKRPPPPPAPPPAARREKGSTETLCDDCKITDCKNWCPHESDASPRGAQSASLPKLLVRELDNLRSLEQPNYAELEKCVKGRELRALWIGLLYATGDPRITQQLASDVLLDELCNALGENDVDYTLLSERYAANLGE